MAGYEAAIHAALHGPENKAIHIRDARHRQHDFNVKKLSLDWTPSQVIAKGQISHRLAGRPDDQVYYTVVINRKDASVANVTGAIEKNPLASFITFNALIGSFIVGLFVPAAGAALAASAPVVREVAARAEHAAVGNWEQASQALIAAIAASLSIAVAARDVAPPPARTKPGGGGRKPTPRPVHER